MSKGDKADKPVEEPKASWIEFILFIVFFLMDLYALGTDGIFFYQYATATGTYCYSSRTIAEHFIAGTSKSKGANYDKNSQSYSNVYLILLTALFIGFYVHSYEILSVQRRCKAAGSFTLGIRRYIKEAGARRSVVKFNFEQFIIFSKAAKQVMSAQAVLLAFTGHPNATLYIKAGVQLFLVASRDFCSFVLILLFRCGCCGKQFYEKNKTTLVNTFRFMFIQLIVTIFLFFMLSGLVYWLLLPTGAFPIVTFTAKQIIFAGVCQIPGATTTGATTTNGLNVCPSACIQNLNSTTSNLTSVNNLFGFNNGSNIPLTTGNLYEKYVSTITICASLPIENALTVTKTNMGYPTWMWGFIYFNNKWQANKIAIDTNDPLQTQIVNQFGKDITSEYNGLTRESPLSSYVLTTGISFLYGNATKLSPNLTFCVRSDSYKPSGFSTELQSLMCLQGDFWAGYQNCDVQWS